MGCADRKHLSWNMLHMNGERVVVLLTHKQSMVAASSTKAEYNVVSDDCNDMLLVKSSLFAQVNLSMPIHNDNHGYGHQLSGY